MACKGDKKKKYNGGSKLLLLTVLFSCFSDRSYSFVVPVCLSRTCPIQTTLFSSIYTFCELAFTCAFTAVIAKPMAKKPRIWSYKLSIILQNVFTGISCLFLVLAILRFSKKYNYNDPNEYDSRFDGIFITYIVFLCVIGGMAAVLSTSAKVLMSKDMIVVTVKRESNNETNDKIAHLIQPKEEENKMEKKTGFVLDDQQSTEDTDVNVISDNKNTNDIVKIAEANICETEVNGELDGENLPIKKNEEAIVLINESPCKEEKNETPNKSQEELREQMYSQLYDYNLAKANRIYSLIDLSMGVCAPIIIGLICDKTWFMDSTKTENEMLQVTMWAAVFVGAWNVLSCIPEALIPSSVIKRYGVVEFLEPQHNPNKKLVLKRFSSQGCVRLMKQKAVIAIISFSLLFCTILTPNSSPLVSYLVGTRDFSSLYISLFAACAQVVGMLGLTLAPALVKKGWYIPDIGGLAIFLQVICIIITVIVFSIDYVSTSEPLIYVALTSIALSRFGLWLFDNIFNLILQKTVNSDETSIVNGALAGMNAVFQAISLLISIFTPVKYFIVIVAISAGVVILSAIIYVIYWSKVRRQDRKISMLSPEDEIKYKEFLSTSLATAEESPASLVIASVSSNDKQEVKNNNMIIINANEDKDIKDVPQNDKILNNNNI